MQNQTAPSPRFRLSFLICIFVLACALRFGLAAVNREAMDDHYGDVIKPLLEGKVPFTTIGKYHPKFFHITAVMVIKVLGVDSAAHRIVVCQLINALVGTLTFALLLLFLMRLNLDWVVLKWLSLFLAFSPGLIAFNAMGSNDTFVIFFSVVSTLSLSFLFSEKSTVKTSIISLLVATVAVYLAIATKGNGLVIGFCAILYSGALVALAIYRKKSVIIPLAAFTFLGLASTYSVAHNTVYFYHPAYYRLLNSDRSVIGPYTGLPKGVRSDSLYGKRALTQAFFTFPLSALLVTPVASYGAPFSHMYSYWAQVYGNATFSRFAYWPPTWRRGDRWLPWIGRAQYLLNVVPVLILVWATFHLALGSMDLSQTSEGRVGRFCAFVTLAHVAAGMRYFTIFLSFVFAKFIYVAPFLAAAVYCFAWGLQRIVRRQDRRATQFLGAVFNSLAIVNLVDVLMLIRDLNT